MADLRIDLTTLDRVAFLDPASGKAPTKRMSARSAITVVGQDHYRRVYVLHAWAGRVPVPTLVKQLFEINRLYKPRVFGGEADALQCLFEEALKMIAADRNEKLPLLPVQHSTKLDKDFRIRTTLQPVIGEGRLVLLASQHELLAELEGFPSYPTKDMVDSLASAIDLLPQRPRQRVKDEESDALAAYLRKSGVAPHIIEQQLQQRGGTTALRASSFASMLAERHRLRRPLPKELR